MKEFVIISIICIMLVIVNGYRSVCNRKINSISSSSSIQLSLAKIALTREEGANDKLKSLLNKYECIEIPCIMFESGIIFFYHIYIYIMMITLKK